MVGQFVAGRAIVYIAVGLAENTATTCQSEITPASGRLGVLDSNLNLIRTDHDFWYQRNLKSCHKSHGLDYISRNSGPGPRYSSRPVGIPCLQPSLVDSKNRKEEAAKFLVRVRTKTDVEEGHCWEEADTVEEALKNATQKEPWHHLFCDVNIRRTNIVRPRAVRPREFPAHDWARLSTWP
ncbi:general substrate transporter [Penicillium riverlandense]|uniref:general substrate transporter n=1 Tax=Penicillium riverlandense TaxID=1903569 RepID=UPI002546AC96|nr:general substrate transporter [Penicillium riverlandense]KAJ5812572.1 general substrate transporter [Penicillium riverlandense]